MSEVEAGDELRFSTGMSELDRVLGGGAVRGSLVLLGGAPGIGKSTLMLQICQQMCRTSKVLYVSGEESERQIKLRAERLRVQGDNLYLLAETNLESIIEAVHQLAPDVLIVDSVQTMQSESADSAAGSVSQIRAITSALTRFAKETGTAAAENATVKKVPIRKEKKAGPNDPCPCGSGRKYKKCCMQKDKESGME